MELMFNVSSRIYLAPGASKSVGKLLAEEGKKKVLFICDGNLEKLGITAAVVEGIEKEGLEITVFDKVNGEPPYTLVEEAAGIVKAKEIDAIVGMGGGSALDTAKCTMIMSANGDILKYADTFDEVEKKGEYLLLIPTTFGTGSEVTDGAVISVPEEDRKITIWGKNCAGDFAVIDPELATGLPASITASTGMDALSHAVEAYTAPNPSPFSDIMALSAIEIILKWLPECITDGKNVEKRAHMCVGATAAGIAFNNGGLNQGHELAHGLGAKFHIPHGTACALSMPLAIKANAEFMPERIEKLAALFGVNDSDKTDGLIRKMVELRKQLGIPDFAELGITEDKFELVGDAWDAEPKGEYPFSPDREYVIDFIKSTY